jgi:hypothetical protein
LHPRSQRAVYGSTDDALSTTSSTGSRHSGGSPLPSSSRGPQVCGANAGRYGFIDERDRDHSTHFA